MPWGNPWWTTLIEKAEEYTGQEIAYPAASNKPTVATKIQNTNSNTIDCIGPDGKQFKTSLDECKKLNESWGKSPDYFLQCNIHTSCGGGSRYVKKSECDNLYCCLLKDGTAKLLSSKSACDHYYSNQPSLGNYPVYLDNTINCSVYYPALKMTQIYRVTPSLCSQFQSEALSSSSLLTIPDLIPSQPQTYYVQPTYTVADCQRDMTDQYRSFMQSSGCYFPCPESGDCGGSNVCEAYWRTFQQDYAKCQ